jgi:ribosomal protein S16
VFDTFSPHLVNTSHCPMALKIRLSRIGSTHNPIYHVVVAEARSRRDGAATEILGTYNPRAKGEQQAGPQGDRRGRSGRSLRIIPDAI